MWGWMKTSWSIFEGWTYMFWIHLAATFGGQGSKLWTHTQYVSGFITIISSSIINKEIKVKIKTENNKQSVCRPSMSTDSTTPFRIWDFA